ncbi:hypothetical protein JYU34_015887 [Plutella xylostella]|uniref:Chromatin assembly factor 1 subunit A dimerization domain-containing protein n=1 Tax=Plutella xylostella TaxID=51655 RepID=A0ABQ7Q4Y1_PLUXY|nr:hypothetical protein JYU34_015887 [Plutella xylostella]
MPTMKATKTPDAAIVVSPSQKKLKQARLPFKILGDVSPAPESPLTRKRKLSAQDNGVASKIGKISKENEDKEDCVLISDEDSKDALKTDKEVSISNPYVKLVSKAIKKKQQKSKVSKKKKNTKNVSETITTNNGVEEKEAKDCDKSEVSDLEPMEVDDKTDISTQEVQEPDNDQNKTNNTSIELEDSNDESDANLPIPEPEQWKSLAAITGKNNETADENETKTKSDNPPSKTVSTPKRSPRIKKSQSEENKTTLNTSVSGSKSIEAKSAPTTPKTPKNTRSSISNGQVDDSLNASNTSLTPKQLQRKLESAKKKEEREKEKQDREKKRLQEKEERDKIKKEKEDLKKKEREEKEEARKKEREEKEELKKKEKEEKEKQKELEKKLREEKEELKRKEKEAKEEERRKEKEAREEERRKRQEALDLEKQEQELKKKKAAEAFANFFVPKQKMEKDQSVIGPVIQNNMLSSFTLKSDMRLAPTVRLELSVERKKTLEEFLKKQDVAENKLYVKSLKTPDVKPGSCGKTWPLDDKDDVVIVEDELQPPDGLGEVICESSVREKLRPKLLSFHENRRPPYWGTWRKRSGAVGPRTPFAQDQKLLDYSVDSADEWEEEAEGESIDGSAAGSDLDDNDDYEVDHELFVPHGYLSDEEATMDEDDVLALSPEAQQARLKHLEDEFASEMRKPTEKLKPRLYGPIWETKDGGRPEKCVDALWNYFQKLAMIVDDVTPLLQPAPVAEETEKKKNKKKKPEKKAPEGEEKSPKNEKKRKAKPEKKETKQAKVVEAKTPEAKKNQRGINSFLTKLKSG